MSIDALRAEASHARDAALDAVRHAADLAAIEKLHADLLGKKSPIRLLMKQLGGLSADERPAAGQVINDAQRAVEELYAERHAALKAQALAQRLEKERIDITLPGDSIPAAGGAHPLSITLHHILQIFASMGFEVADGPEIETERHNFDALNIAANHPARDMHDTFYVDAPPTADQGAWILRTHTSPIQVRWMETHQPPVAIVAPGRVYRVDDIDATHSPVFHQLEGLLVDKGITFAHLKGTIESFLQALFGAGLKARFRPSFFPFTEPSAEFDMQCFACRGKDTNCRVCKGSGWIEVGGAGMVHPNVLRNVGYDPEQVSGFAFGLGLERVCMMRHSISTIRSFYENDVRFLEQFRGAGSLV